MSVWAIDGAQVPASNARTVLFQATGGARGVALAGDMRVVATTVPSENIVIRRGSCVMPNDYLGVGGGGQSYGIQLESSVTLAVPATGAAGGATRYVIARVNDPEFSGVVPANPATYKYDSYHIVGSIPTSYPNVVLARIKQPANTTIITQSMITDMREIANPRSKQIVTPRPMIAADDVGYALELTSRTAYPRGEWFPNKGGQDNNGLYYADVPLWATRMEIRMEWLSVRYAQKAGWGLYWVTYGPQAGVTATDPPYATQAFQFDANESNTYRSNWILHQEVSVPSSWRGTTIPFLGRAMLKNAKNSSFPGKVELDGLSGMVFSVRFLETADESD